MGLSSGLTGNGGANAGTAKVGPGIPVVWYDPQGGGPNMAVGSVLGNLSEPTAYSNIAFGGGWRVGVPQTGNLGQVTTGYDNTAIGAGVLVSATTGHSNVAVGSDAASALTTGAGNTAIGAQALENLTTAANSTAVGSGAASQNTGALNVAIGASALGAAGAGTQNTAGGANALPNVTSGSSNAAWGYFAMGALNTGSSNSGVGQQVLGQVANGSNNSAIGQQAGYNITGGSYCTALGWNAGYTDGTTATVNVNRATLIGEQAQTTVGDVIVLGKAIATRPNMIFGGVGASAAFGSGVGVFAIANAATDPSTNPTGGGILYASGGALKWRGSSGTVTTVAVA